jgi:hypothetical protein
MTDTQSLPAAPTATSSSAPAPAAASNGLSVASLVLSILAIPTGMAILAVVGIVLGFVGWNREPQSRTLATWGIVIGFVVALGGLLLAAVGFAIAAPFALWGLSFAGF